MRINKLKLLIAILSTSFLLSGVSPAFAYSDSVNKKIERLEDNIKKEQEKIDKDSKKRSNRNNRSSYSSSYSSSNNNSSSKKREKYQEKIEDYREEIADIKEKEDVKIEKKVKVINTQKQQSQNKIRNLQAAKAKKINSAKEKYQNDVKREIAKNPAYVAPAFDVNTLSDDRLISLEQEKTKKLDMQIETIKNPQRKMK